MISCPHLSQPISTHSTAPSCWPQISTMRSASTHPPTGHVLNTSSSILTGTFNISPPSRSVLYCSKVELFYIIKLKPTFAWLFPLKATWHPLYDLIVVGRYPDDRVCPGDERTIDVYDSNTAELVCQLQDPTAAGIKSVSRFSPMHPNLAQRNPKPPTWFSPRSRA